MHVSQETPAAIDQRLREVAALTRVELLDGLWWYDQSPEGPPAKSRPDAIALVRGENGWCQLVPVRPGDQPGERFRLWSCHFPEGMDNSGFIGWLASRLKARTGSGALVVCGYDAERGGIYDYWGCPADAADEVVKELRALTMPGPKTGAAEPRTLDGLRMRPVASPEQGEVNPETLFRFTQSGSTISAHYSGGAVRLGYLVGTRNGMRLEWRYAQVGGSGALDGGHALCELELLADGRMRLIEHFSWESRSGTGTNVLEQVDDGDHGRYTGFPPVA